MKRNLFSFLLLFWATLPHDVSQAQGISYDLQLLQAQRDLKRVCVKYDKDKLVFDRIEIKRKANSKLQSDLRDKVIEAQLARRGDLLDAQLEPNLTPAQFNARIRQIEQDTKEQIAGLHEQLRQAVRTEWAEFGRPYQEARESFEVSKFVKERAQNILEKLKKSKPGKIVGTDGRKRESGSGDNKGFDEDLARLKENIEKLNGLQDPSSPNHVDRKALKKLEERLDGSIDRTERLEQIADRILNPEAGAPRLRPTGEIAQTGAPVIFGVDIGVGGEIMGLPDYDIGVVNLGVNPNPLHRFDKSVIGPGGHIGFDFRQRHPDAHGGRLFGRIEAGFATFDRSEDQTIPGFPAGQVPAYIDITGVNGFAFNNNSIVSQNVEVTRYGLKGEAGWEKQLNRKLIIVPYAGGFLRRTEIDYNVTMDTDFNNGRFFNNLDERMRLNQYGLDVGLDLTYMPRNRLALTIGGHGGLVYTDTSYSGSDCGDGSILTGGCDGALFRNSGVSRGRDSIDPFGGLKAAIGIYFFCRAHSTEIAAGLITAAVSALKNHCAEVSAQGSFEITPTTRIDRPTALGATGVQLSADYVPSGAFSIRGRIPLTR